MHRTSQTSIHVRNTNPLMRLIWACLQSLNSACKVLSNLEAGSQLVWSMVSFAVHPDCLLFTKVSNPTDHLPITHLLPTCHPPTTSNITHLLPFKNIASAPKPVLLFSKFVRQAPAVALCCGPNKAGTDLQAVLLLAVYTSNSALCTAQFRQETNQGQACCLASGY